jgi:hypothetical protein
LAFGDGFATLVGAKFGKRPIYKEKTLEGFLACTVFTAIPLAVYNLICGPLLSVWHILLLSLIAAIVELIDFGLDNLALPIFTFFASYLMSVTEAVTVAFAIGAAVFAVAFFTGLIRYYGALLASNGHNDDFADEYGMPLCLINLGFHGFSVLAYMALMIAFTDGAGFTGPTCGALLAALSFFAIGQHPRIVWPIFVGYGLLFAFAQVTGGIGGFDPGWTLSTQAYLNGLAFATGLCPIAGRFGWKSGVLAGAACAAMCSSTSVIHGGFCLYNGGFTAGITCFILVPILEHYLKTKNNTAA